MFAIALGVFVTIALSYTAYVVFYAVSGRYAQDERFDAYTKRS